MIKKGESPAHLASSYIKKRHPDFKPTIGIILGSGLGGFAEKILNPVVIDYEQLPGFPLPTVHGHSGKMILGNIGNIEVVCLQGRAHAYEGMGHDAVINYIRTLKLLGCEYLLATNASGSLRQDVGPGELMLITDHINMQPGNPLVGLNNEEFGPRFFGLDNAYNQEMRDELLTIAQKQNIPLHQGVYIAVLGPNYETAAEIKAFRILGADAVGMSTVPEVLVANHCGMKVAVIATITNYATGLNKESHSHESVVEVATKAGQRLSGIIEQFVEGLA